MLKKKTNVLRLDRETLRAIAGEKLDAAQGGALRITMTTCTFTDGVTCLDC